MKDNAYQTFGKNLEIQFNLRKVQIAANQIPYLQLLRITICEVSGVVLLST